VSSYCLVLRSSKIVREEEWIGREKEGEGERKCIGRLKEKSEKGRGEMRGGGRGWGGKEVTGERKMNGKRKVEGAGKKISRGRGENEVDSRGESVVKGKGERLSGRKEGKGRWNKGEEGGRWKGLG
jgi:hypothetical protein